MLKGWWVGMLKAPMGLHVENGESEGQVSCFFETCLHA